MKKTITFNQLKRLVKEGLEPRGRKWGDIKRELIGERNDEDPVTIDDMPSKLVAQLKAIGCQLEDSETTGSTTKLPYVWALISARGHVPKGVVKKAVEKFGWHIIDTEPPYEGEPRFTFWLSPYGNPHEPGADFIDRLIDKDREGQAEREKEYAMANEGAEIEDEEECLVKLVLKGILQGGDESDLDLDIITDALEETTNVDPPFTADVRFMGKPKVKTTTGVNGRGKPTSIKLAEVPVQVTVEISSNAVDDPSRTAVDCADMIDEILQDVNIATTLNFTGKVEKIPFDEA